MEADMRNDQPKLKRKSKGTFIIEEEASTNANLLDKLLSQESNSNSVNNINSTVAVDNYDLDDNSIGKKKSRKLKKN